MCSYVFMLWPMKIEKSICTNHCIPQVTTCRPTNHMVQNFNGGIYRWIGFIQKFDRENIDG